MSISKFDVAYMKMARAMSSLSHDYKTKVGCVIVKDKHVISTGYNGMPRGIDPGTRDEFNQTRPEVIHAEMNALLAANRSSQSTENATCYTTLRPCLKCAIHLYQAGITEIVYSDAKCQHISQEAAKAWLATTSIKIRRVSDESNTENIKVPR